MDHIHGFKTLSKKSQRYTSFLLILSAILITKMKFEGLIPLTSVGVQTNYHLFNL